MSNFKGVIMKISEIAKETGLTVRAVRYYEELNLINSDRLDNNYRDYDKEALFKVSFISRARKLGFSIDECSSLITITDIVQKLLKLQKLKEIN
jgi:MerR family copper efflux transcriptional regulator